LESIQNNCIVHTIDFFTEGSVPNFSWYMQDGSLSTNSNAETTPTYNRTTNNVSTTFDYRKYTSGSDLAVARTLLHESVHAYLVTYFGTNINASSTYSDLVDNYYNITHQNLNAAQHNIMVTSFTGSIAVMLQNYGQSKGYNIPYQYYSDLAWGGLTYTTAFTSLSQTDKNRIMDVLNTEQVGRNRYGNQAPLKVSPSGCQ